MERKLIDTSKMQVGSKEWSHAWEENRITERVMKYGHLKKLGKFLFDNGFKYIRVAYEGSGDSGDCFYAEGFKDKKSFDNRGWHEHENYGNWNDGKRTFKPGEDKWSNFTRFQKDLVDLYAEFQLQNPKVKSSGECHWDIVDMINYDWYNNEGGQGDVLWDLENNCITVEGEQNQMSSIGCEEIYDLSKNEPKTTYKLH